MMSRTLYKTEDGRDVLACYMRDDPDHVHGRHKHTPHTPHTPYCVYIMPNEPVCGEWMPLADAMERHPPAEPVAWADVAGNYVIPCNLRPVRRASTSTGYHDLCGSGSCGRGSVCYFGRGYQQYGNFNFSHVLDTCPPVRLLTPAEIAAVELPEGWVDDVAAAESAEKPEAFCPNRGDSGTRCTRRAGHPGGCPKTAGALPPKPRQDCRRRQGCLSTEGHAGACSLRGVPCPSQEIAIAGCPEEDEALVRGLRAEIAELKRCNANQARPLERLLEMLKITGGIDDIPGKVKALQLDAENARGIAEARNEAYDEITRLQKRVERLKQDKEIQKCSMDGMQNDLDEAHEILDKIADRFTQPTKYTELPRLVTDLMASRAIAEEDAAKMRRKSDLLDRICALVGFPAGAHLGLPTKVKQLLEYASESATTSALRSVEIAALKQRLAAFEQDPHLGTIPVVYPPESEPPKCSTSLTHRTFCLRYEHGDDSHWVGTFEASIIRCGVRNPSGHGRCVVSNRHHTVHLYGPEMPAARYRRDYEA